MQPRNHTKQLASKTGKAARAPVDERIGNVSARRIVERRTAAQTQHPEKVHLLLVRSDEGRIPLDPD